MVTGRTPGFVALVVILSFLFPAITEQAVPRQTGVTGFSDGRPVAKVTSSKITEASGLAASRRHPGYLYTHNDSGGKPSIYVIDKVSGHREATLHIGATNHDWEDICVGPCAKGSTKSCIYIADTGDAGNSAVNIVYKVEEPTHIASQDLQVLSLIKFSWNQADSETLLCDPHANVYVISKTAHGHGVIAQLPPDAWGSGIRVPLSSSAVVGVVSNNNDPVGGDISPNGREVVIKTHNALFYWNVGETTDYVSALTTLGSPVPVSDDPHGEAVCWDPQGQGYYTLTEGHDEYLYYYGRL